MTAATNGRMAHAVRCLTRPCKFRCRAWWITEIFLSFRTLYIQVGSVEQPGTNKCLASLVDPHHVESRMEVILMKNLLRVVVIASFAFAFGGAPAFAHGGGGGHGGGRGGGPRSAGGFRGGAGHRGGYWGGYGGYGGGFNPLYGYGTGYPYPYAPYYPYYYATPYVYGAPY